MKLNLKDRGSAAEYLKYLPYIEVYIRSYNFVFLFNLGNRVAFIKSISYTKLRSAGFRVKEVKIISVMSYYKFNFKSFRRYCRGPLPSDHFRLY